MRDSNFNTKQTILFERELIQIEDENFIILENNVFNINRVGFSNSANSLKKLEECAVTKNLKLLNVADDFYVFIKTNKDTVFLKIDDYSFLGKMLENDAELLNLFSIKNDIRKVYLTM